MDSVIRTCYGSILTAAIFCNDSTKRLRGRPKSPVKGRNMERQKRIVLILSFILFVICSEVFAQSVNTIGEIGTTKYQCLISREGNTAATVKGGVEKVITSAKLFRLLNKKKIKTSGSIKKLKLKKKEAKNKKKIIRKIAAKKKTLAELKKLASKAKQCKKGTLDLKIEADGAFLEIPLEAVREGIAYSDITIESVPTDVETSMFSVDGEAASNIYKLGPEGTEFNSPVRLRIPFTFPEDGSSKLISAFHAHSYMGEDSLDGLESVVQEGKGNESTALYEFQHFSNVVSTARSSEYFEAVLESPNEVLINENFIATVSIFRNSSKTQKLFYQSTTDPVTFERIRRVSNSHTLDENSVYVELIELLEFSDDKNQKICLKPARQVLYENHPFSVSSPLFSSNQLTCTCEGKHFLVVSGHIRYREDTELIRFNGEPLLGSFQGRDVLVAGLFVDCKKAPAQGNRCEKETTAYTVSCPINGSRTELFDVFIPLDAENISYKIVDAVTGEEYDDNNTVCPGATQTVTHSIEKSPPGNLDKQAVHVEIQSTNSAPAPDKMLKIVVSWDC